MWRVVARADVPGARHHGGRADLDRAGRHRHGAVGPARAPRRPAVAPAGRRRQDRIPLYTTEGGWLHLPTEALVEGAVQARAEGFHGAKLKVGRPHVAEDVARIAAVREAVGDDWDIMVDANQGFRCPRRSAARAFEPLDIAWLEEPIHADDVHAHRRLSASTTVPIAVGESLYSLSQFKDYLQSDACSVVQVDVGRIGGITPWLKVAHMAEAYNVPVCPHFLMEIHVALCCAVPNSRWLEYIPQLDLITQSGMRIEDGHGVPSQAPGLGIDWDWAGIERLARHRSRHG